MIKTTQTNLAERALESLWHPCSQMKDYEQFPAIPLSRAEGPYLYTESGHQIIDAVSSWWCKSLGHQHPRLQQALFKQCQQLEHVILANTCNDTIVRLSEALTQLTQTLNKVMYASDGSCAVEIALKMAVHGQALRGKPHKKEFIALSNGYHGETALTLSVSDLGLYKAPYECLMRSVPMIPDIPLVSGRDDPLWHDCADAWQSAEAFLEPLIANCAAIIIEPILQGAGGMQLYSADFLRRLRAYCQAHDVWLIADEIMTGFGRTGKMLACEHAGIEPDMLCLSKGLTSGMLPMSATVVRDDIYHLFYDDYQTGKAFMHSHTHTGNTLAASVALASIDVMREERLCEHVSQQEKAVGDLMQHVATETGMLHNIRHIGAMAAADITPHYNKPRAGYRVLQHAIQKGALLRPLGNTIYWVPPLNMAWPVWENLADITIAALSELK